jgi:hypothetical protein
MPMRPRPRFAAHHWYRLAAMALAIGLACDDTAAQRGSSSAAQGGPAVRGGGPPRDPGQGPGGGRVFGRGRANQPTGTAVIRGRVTAFDTGAPVRRAQVAAAATGVGAFRSATTDAEGWFELRDLPGGAWTLTASKPGYVTQRLGQRRPFESVAPLQVVDGQQTNSANFALAKGGAITGRIFDDLGDPLANARVQALRTRTIEGRRRLVPAGAEDVTDDTGAFRLYGLAPGDYYVSASTGGLVGAAGGVFAAPVNAIAFSAGAMEPIQVRGGGSSAPTYFPGTANAAEAQRIRLGTSEETTISFGLLSIRTASVSGTVLSADGSQTAGGAVSLQSADGDDLSAGLATGAPILADGAFSIPNVAPGTYVLTARSGGLRGPIARRGGEMQLGTVTVTVNGEDVSGVTIVMTRGATLEGSVVAAGGSRPMLNGARVLARPARGFAGPIAAAGGAPVTAAGTFQLSSLQGAVRLSVEGLPAGWMVQSIEVDGVDVTDSGLDLKGTEQITDARVTLTNRIAELNGTVTQGGQWARDFSVLVFADDETRWTFPGRFVRSARGSAQGNFSVRGLPPGVGYLAAAVSHLEEGEAEDPEFLSSLRERATSVSLREGETKTIELRLIER